ncbi:hypothetical protein QQF64_002059 [Cirrhinus molitorella]|uniref:Dehydrogenase/reductase SDR family member 13 n=1 Tax=Cirrhinus molitorella TaxID=172907 RepID=A0ABR3MP25_9TELE
MFTVLLICGGLVGLYLLLYVTVLKQPKCKSTAKLHGKTVIVTGANTGIGKATALDLAKRGARVILACRDESRAQAAVTDIQRESGNKEVLYMHLDLASLKSVRSFAENFLKRESRLDILINNAGLVVGGKTEDGFGRIFGVNHLGHFLLTTLLLERLKESGPSRIVTVSSNAHWWGKIDFDCINTHKDLGLGKSAVAIMRLYGHSKLCNVLFTYELAKRLKGTNVTCYSLHPGAIKTEIGRHTSILWRLVLAPFFLLFFFDVESGAQTSLYCALQQGIESLSGRYFSGCAVQNVFAKARDDAVSKKLWEVSERLLICGGLVGFYLLLCVTMLRLPKCKSTAKLHGKTVIVTGANTGIGKATALDLAKRGARVILACRDESRAQAAVTHIQNESGNKEVLYMHLDLASLKSVRSFVENFLKKESRLDILINNAGLVMGDKTEDGFGSIFGINHLGHFLLTILLLESKLCNVLFTHELAKRLKGTNVTCYSLHPGGIKTEIGRHVNIWWQLVLVPILLLFFSDVESGAQTSLYCALQEGIEPLSGRYFSNCAVQNVSAKARDDAVAKKLWEVSERLVALYVVLVETLFKKSKCKGTADMTGKTAIITGGNTGIGKATALDLAGRGVRVILACRNQKKAEGAINDIKKATGSNDILFMELDLGSLKSVRAFAENFLKSESRLDLLINNAGLVADGRTEDGFGIEFGVNHLGHFLLTCLLLDRLKESPAARVITLSSMAHRWGKIDFDSLVATKDLGSGRYSWQFFQAYCNSKLCNILFTHELAKRLKGTNVTCYSVHPGVVKTELSRHVSLWQKVFIEPVARLLFLDPKTGAQTTLHCASQEGIEHFSGRYFSCCAVEEVSAKAKDDAVAKKLWEVSERLSGLS